MGDQPKFFVPPLIRPEAFCNPALETFLGVGHQDRPGAGSMPINRFLKLNSNTEHPCRRKRHRLVPASPIAQNDRIDNFTTLHTAFRRKLRLADVAEYIQAEVLHHESAASGAHRFMLGCGRNCVIPELFGPRFLLECCCHDYLTRFYVHCLQYGGLITLVNPPYRPTLGTLRGKRRSTRLFPSGSDGPLTRRLAPTRCPSAW